MMKTQLLKFNVRSKVIVSSLFLVVISAFMALHASAQQPSSRGIQFSSKSYQEVISEAKASHKKVFVDAFATWCAPCKLLQKKTFKDPKAAAYFNRHFINFSIDVEKGEGIALAKTWQVEGLPTLLILDENGTVLAEHTGFVDGDGLIQFAGAITSDPSTKSSGGSQND